MIFEYMGKDKKGDHSFRLVNDDNTTTIKAWNDDMNDRRNNKRPIR